MTVSPRRTLSASAVRHILALAVLATACGPSSQPAPAAGKRLDACALFTAADAQAVLGESEVVEMSSFLNEAKGSKDPSQCGYNAAHTAGEAACNEIANLTDKLSLLPATTMRGLRMKAALAAKNADADLVWSVIDDLNAVPGVS